MTQWESRTLGFSRTPRNGNPVMSGQFMEEARLSNLHVQSKGVIEVETQEDLVARIPVATGVIRDMPEMLPRVRHDIIRRYKKCIEVGGGHIEHLL